MRRRRRGRHPRTGEGSARLNARGTRSPCLPTPLLRRADLWTRTSARATLDDVRWGYVVCLVAFHKWVRRRTDDGAGDVHVCVRCGKVLDWPDADPRFQGLG